MCFTNTCKNYNQWNWDGEQIIHETIVPSSRPPVGHTRGGYDIDVREFLTCENNAVMRRTIEIDIRGFIADLPYGNWELFCSHSKGAFDYRAYVISEYVSQKITYYRRDDNDNDNDPWQFPEETLELKSGDCEDRAFLIASLLLTSGVSPFNVRVTLGQFIALFGNNSIPYDHVWVMYKNEEGQWHIIEPAHTYNVNLKKSRPYAQLPDRCEYVPYYVFNNYHLWEMPSSHKKGSVSLKKDWSTLHPEFAGSAHQSILNDALKTIPNTEKILSELNSRHFTRFLWRKDWTIDDADNPYNYHPYDHFDNGYIKEGWDLVIQRLEQFKVDNLKNLDMFHLAAHGIADFYAHSSYAHFANRNYSENVLEKQLELYNPNCAFDKPAYNKNSDFSLASSDKFKPNYNLWNGSMQERVIHWQGQIISGRYGQSGDSKGFIEPVNFIPAKLEESPDFFWRGSLPHHNEIAVDEPSGNNTLYAEKEYEEQYKLRYGAAVRHIRQEFEKNWNSR